MANVTVDITIQRLLTQKTVESMSAFIFFCIEQWGIISYICYINNNITFKCLIIRGLVV